MSSTTRRQWIQRSAMTLVGASVGGSALAGTHCQAGPWGHDCRSGIDFRRFYRRAYDTQHASQWCWAACIEMLFAHRGFRVEQPRIVQEAYGGLVNWPATGMTMARQLQRPWIDDHGRRFRARITGLYDAHAGIHALNNAGIVGALDAERPLIVGARGHAVVLTQVDHVPTPMGPSIRSAMVFDPWPGRGFRPLMPDELVPLGQGGSLQFAIGVNLA